ncbi:hypothetical protein HPP92_002747 [Vanilla planifolia]|uniref:Uncharacterized protein n=1 Tax=Vanilla planifolia TaxID=51239 RepID=A0A835VMM9_VANPL|nr:hypothetical protein HPP92_002747 [Vanilla planifolia]
MFNRLRVQRMVGSISTERGRVQKQAGPVKFGIAGPVEVVAHGTNPEDLPKKWRCSMQFWLPGLNNCNVSEDETTKAFHELYPVPVPVSDTNLTSHLDAAASTVTSAGPFNPDRRLKQYE